MATRTPKTPTNEAKPVTFSPEKMAEILNEITETRKLVAEQMAEIAALKARPAKAQAANGQSVSAKNDLACLRIFKKAGFKDVKPRENVLTFNRWVEQGRRPVEGSKSLKVSGLRLFHVSQTRPLTAEERGAAKAKADEAVDANKAKIDAAVGRDRKGKVIPLNGGEASPQ
jgi:hypothetical protein